MLCPYGAFSRIGCMDSISVNVSLTERVYCSCKFGLPLNPPRVEDFELRLQFQSPPEWEI